MRQKNFDVANNWFPTIDPQPQLAKTLRLYQCSKVLHYKKCPYFDLQNISVDRTIRGIIESQQMQATIQ